MALYSPHKPQPFLFVHIYRTGGNSLRALISGPDTFQIGSPHSLPDDVQRLLSPDAWQRAFRFTIVRHPYTWLASTWELVRRVTTHRDHEHAQGGFPDFVRWVADVGHAVDNGPLRDRYARLSEFARGMDHVYRFEDHPAPMLDVCQKLGIPKPRAIPHRGKGTALVAIDAETKTFIQREWAEDFERFGYDG